jgi:hypothetical protein
MNGLPEETVSSSSSSSSLFSFPSASFFSSIVSRCRGLAAEPAAVEILRPATGISSCLSMQSSRLVTFSKESAILKSCCLSSTGFSWVQHINLKRPAKETSSDPSVSSEFAPGIRPKNPPFFARFFASSAAFFSASNSFYNVNRQSHIASYLTLFRICKNFVRSSSHLFRFLAHNFSSTPRDDIQIDQRVNDQQKVHRWNGQKIKSSWHDTPKLLRM